MTTLIGAKGRNRLTKQTTKAPVRLVEGWRFAGPVERPGPEDRLDPEVVAAWSAPELDDTGWEAVTVPHTVVPLSWELWDAATWEKVWAYRRTLTLRPKPGERVFLDFGAAMTAATVTLNGVVLGTHTGGYLPFTFEITDHITDGDNHLAVLLDSRFNINVPPGAPDMVSSASIDFYQPGGLHRDVWLRREPAVFIAEIALTNHDELDPETRRTTVVVTVDASEALDDCALTARLLDRSGVVLSESSLPRGRVAAGTFEATIVLDGLADVLLWDVNDPQLYDVEVDLAQGDEIVSSSSRRTGYREARFELDGFYLNGRRRYLLGVNRHEYFPYQGFAMPDRVHRKDADIIRNDLNCLMVRCSHYPQTTAFLDACDELGLLVWEETPGWHFVGDEHWRYAALGQLEGMIARDRHRPSIVVWGARLNETPDRPEFYARTEALVKRLDPSRATSGAMHGDYSRQATFQHDVFSYDDYNTRLEGGDRRPDLLPATGDRPYLVSESVAGRSSPTTHYRRTEGAAIAQHQALDYANAHSDARGAEGVSGLLAWLAFDYQSPRGNGRRGVRYTGLVDMFREPKPGAALYRSQVSPTKRVVIEPAFAWDPPQFGRAHGYADRPEMLAWGPGAEAIVCSNCDRLEVSLGDGRPVSVEPDRQRFPHLEHPPSFVDLRLPPLEPGHEHERGHAHGHDLRIDGFVGDERVLTRRWSADRSADSLAIRADDGFLVADGADGTRVVVSVVDRFGNARATSPVQVALEVDGPAVLLGEPMLDLERTGAVAAVWLRTVRDRPGTIVVRASTPGFGSDTATIISECVKESA